MGGERGANFGLIPGVRVPNCMKFGEGQLIFNYSPIIIIKTDALQSTSNAGPKHL